MRRTVAVLSLTVIAAVPLRAQDSLAARLAAVSYVRIHTAAAVFVAHDVAIHDGMLRYGRAVVRDRRSGGAVSVANPLPLAEVQQLQVPRGNRAGRGALIGGAVAGMAGLLLFAGAAMEDNGYFTADAILPGAIGAAALGALVGFVIGAGTSDWEVVYP